MARRFLPATTTYIAVEALGDLFTTGATETNVNDFRSILIE